MTEGHDHVVVPPTVVRGRQTELAELRRVLRSASEKVLFITGEPGVGKTTLANLAFTESSQSGVEYDSYHPVPAYGRNWDALLDDIFRCFPLDREALLRPEAMARGIIDAATKRSCLLFVDNVERDVIVSDGFRQFLDSWTKADHHSTLMLTMREDQALIEGYGCTLPLEGLQERAAILAILGDVLRERFADDVLLDAAAKLRNIPQKLLYLSWQQPTTPVELAEAVEMLSRATDVKPVREVLRRIGQPTDHFQALGLFRRIEVDHDLLRFLWDELVGDSANRYGKVVARLLELKILIEGITETNRYRVHPDVHLDLRRMSEARGAKWLRRVHSAAAKFYGACIPQDFRQDHPDLPALDDYTYHTLALRDYETAYAAVFHTSGLDQLHNRGLALQLEPILQQLRGAATHFSAIEQATLLIELSQTYSDLSRHYRCLEYLREALDKVNREPESPEIAQLQRDAYRLLAISSADLGNTNDTIDYYAAAVDLDQDAEDPRTALCMGYLGYNHCELMKFEEAYAWTEKALHYCPDTRDAGIHAKNVCNRALVLFYSGKVPAARTHFELALKRAGNPESPAYDIRENGRILMYLGMVYLSQADVPIEWAEQTLQRALELTQKAGDARRRAISQGLLGVVEYHKQNYGNAQQHLREAIASHRELCDFKNLIIELLNLCMVSRGSTSEREPANVHELIQSASELLPREILAELDELLQQALNDRLYQHFLEFWFQCIRPRIFAKH